MSDPKRYSLFDLNSRMRTSMSRMRLGEVASKWRQHYDEVLKDPSIVDPQDNIKILVFNGEQNGTLFSSLIHVFQLDTVVGYYIHVVEGSSDPLESVIARRNQVEVKLVPVCSQTVDDVYRSKVHNFVQSQVAATEIIYCGFGVILTTLQPSVDAVIPFIFTAVSSIDAKMTEKFGGQVFNLGTQVDPETDILRAMIEYDPDPVPDMNNLPVRSDVSVVISGAKKSDRPNEPHTNRVIARLDAYVDLVLDPDASVGANQFMSQPMYGQRPMARFVPRIVLTRADVRFNIVTPETQLFQLALAGFLQKNNYFMGVWRPRRNLKSSEDWRDIGALNYEVRLVSDPKRPDARVKIDTKNETTFSDNNAYQFMQACINPMPIFSMDVELGGPYYTIQKLFVDAANKNDDARKKIILAANRLTNNNFSGLYTGDGSLFVSDENDIDIGYYVDSNGEKQDIRNVDHLAMLNMFGETNMELVDRHAATYDDAGVDMDLRLHNRRTCQTSAIGTPVIRNRATRINVEPRFMMALVEACAKAGLQITPNNLSFEYGSGIRGRTNVRTLMMDNNAGASTFFSGSNFGSFDRNDRNSW